MNVRKLSTSLLTTVSVALGTGFALSVSQAHAGELDPKAVEKVETLSVGGGFLAGAAVGGPPGAFVGAVVGAIAGDHFLVRKENKLLAANLDDSRDQLAYLQAANSQLQAQLSESQNAQRNLVASISHQPAATACCGDSELVLHFRSNSSTVEDLYDDQLEDFVAYVESVPGAIVEIYGYADRRGEQTDNLWLSQERVQSVEKSLRDLGLSNFTYETTALGEGQPVTDIETPENNFFDRRVVLRVRKDDQKELASSTR
jgi:peptidoglycan-associated lipoprotein